MLSWLKIRNYLLIDQLEMDFPDGFITMTGETGAGKSILLGALSLLTGKRADTSVLLDADSKCIVEGGFLVEKYELNTFFVQHELDYETECIIRREISNKGKSRAFINDTPVRLDLLKQLAEQLIDIHSQHQSLLLSDPAFQLRVLDSFSGLNARIKDYRKEYFAFRKKEAELFRLKDLQKQSLEKQDFIQFQYEQLEDAKLSEPEWKELQKQEKVLQHAGEIRQCLENISHNLENGDHASLAVLQDLIRELSNIKKHYSQAESYYERLESVRIELQDIVREAEINANDIQMDPGKLEQVTNRLDEINSLLQKHSKATVAELIELKQDFETSLKDIAQDSTRMHSLEKECAERQGALQKTAEHLSKERKTYLPQLSEKVMQLLTDLGMPEAKFMIESLPEEGMHAYGTDKIRFLFTANKDVKAEALEKVASGGEMARLMLVLKSILVEKIQLPVIVFDEIDTGVSGEIAGKMGRMMKEMSQNLQVFAITHLPQVAALGSAHFFIYKKQEDKRTVTRIKQLNHEDRIREIAQMSSGEELAESALLHARKLLEQAI